MLSSALLLTRPHLCLVSTSLFAMFYTLLFLCFTSCSTLCFAVVGTSYFALLDALRHALLQSIIFVALYFILRSISCFASYLTLNDASLRALLYFYFTLCSALHHSLLFFTLGFGACFALLHYLLSVMLCLPQLHVLLCFIFCSAWSFSSCFTLNFALCADLLYASLLCMLYSDPSFFAACLSNSMLSAAPWLFEAAPCIFCRMPYAAHWLMLLHALCCCMVYPA